MPRRNLDRARTTGGMTLIELMIVVLIIGVIGSVAVPNVMAARAKNNESSAITTLRSLNTSQEQFQAGVRADVDSDGVGEFGLIRELSGAAPVRTSETGGSTGATLTPALLSSSFGAMNADGEVVRAGFHFKVFLPGENGKAMGERSLTKLESSGPTSIDSDLCERMWGGYAWPALGEGMGTRTFFVNQDGEMTQADVQDDTQRGANGVRVGLAGSALAPGYVTASLMGSPAVAAVGRDGREWTPVR